MNIFYNCNEQYFLNWKNRNFYSNKQRFLSLIDKMIEIINNLHNVAIKNLVCVWFYFDRLEIVDTQCNFYLQFRTLPLRGHSRQFKPITFTQLAHNTFLIEIRNSLKLLIFNIVPVFE